MKFMVQFSLTISGGEAGDDGRDYQNVRKVYKMVKSPQLPKVASKRLYVAFNRPMSPSIAITVISLTFS
jgi:hypothetical protein